MTRFPRIEPPKPEPPTDEELWRDTVTKLSNGRVGYIHIQAMNQPSLRKFEKELREVHQETVKDRERLKTGS